MDPVDGSVRPPLPEWAPIPWRSNPDDDAAGPAAADDAADGGEDAAAAAAGARDRTLRIRSDSDWWRRSIPSCRSNHRPS